MRITFLLISFLIFFNSVRSRSFSNLSFEKLGEISRSALQDSSELEFRTVKKAKSYLQKKEFQNAIKEIESIQYKTNSYLIYLLIQSHIEMTNFPIAKEMIAMYYSSPNQSVSLVTVMKDYELKIKQAYREDSISYQDFKNSYPALKNYIKRRPYTFFKSEILDKIDEYEYKSAETANTENAYVQYLSEHPKGRYQSNAKEKIINLITQENNLNIQEADEYTRMARKSTTTAILLAPIIPAAAIGSYFGLKMTLENDDSVIGPIILGVSGAGFLTSTIFMIFNIIDVKSHKKWTKFYRSKTRPLPSFSQIQLSPFSDFKSIGGLTIQLKF